MVFKLVKPNDGFVIGKPNTLKPHLLLTTQKPLDITSTGITLIFWRTAKQTTIAKSETLFIQELEPAFSVNFGSEKLMLHLSTLRIDILIVKVNKLFSFFP